jgi:glycosyltransferase involved in cell wall biosynthesis
LSTSKPEKPTLNTSSREGNLRVCFFSLGAYHFFNPGVEHAFGGAELQLHLLATHLAKDPGFDVSFIVGEYGQPRRESRQGVALYSFDTNQGGLKYTKTMGYYLRLWRLLKDVDSRVYIQRTAGVLTLAIALFCKVFGRKFVYMVAHDEDLMVATPAWYGGGARGWLGWRLFSRGLRMSDLVIVQHEGQKEELARVFGKEGVVRPSAHLIPADGPAGSRNFFLWVARCEPWKRPGIYLDIARSLPGDEFVMICPPSQDRDLFDSVRRRAGDLRNVQFHDYVPHQEMASYFRRARAFVNTSRKEGFPNTFVEAAREGTPVLSLSVDPDGVLEGHGFGRAFGGDAGGLSSFLGRLRPEGGEWERLSKNARSYALRHHDIGRIVEEDKRLLSSLAGRTVPPGRGGEDRG